MLYHEQSSDKSSDGSTELDMKSIDSDEAKFQNKKLNRYIDDEEIEMNRELIDIIKSLEKNTDPDIEAEDRERYLKKNLIPMVKEIDVFKKGTENMKSDDFKFIAERMKFHFYKPGEIVFEYNDIGNLFYLVIQGTCSVEIPLPQKPKAATEIDSKKNINLFELQDILKKKNKKISNAITAV